jgi:hypothetical protein
VLNPVPDRKVDVELAILLHLSGPFCWRVDAALCQLRGPAPDPDT